MKSQLQLFKDTGIFRLQYPSDLREAVLKAQSSWNTFWRLQTHIKMNLPYSNGGTGVGYELKDGVGSHADRKENFDITVEGSQWLEQHASQIESMEALQFIRDAAALVPLLKPSLLEFAQQVEFELGLAGFADEVAASDAGIFIRFIHYFGGREEGEETATAHVDQSAFTFHLFESDPGLQCLMYDDRQWEDTPVSGGETVIFPGMQLQHRSGGALRALAHRVVANGNTRVHGRTSAVCFLQLQQSPRYNKEFGGRLQEKEPGFNYDMSPEEFSRMFK